jgi:hypothetical protein
VFVSEKNNILTDLENHIKVIEAERDMYASKNNDLQQQLTAEQELQEKMWEQFNAKLEQWKVMLMKKYPSVNLFLESSRRS